MKQLVQLRGRPAAAAAGHGWTQRQNPQQRQPSKYEHRLMQWRRVSGVDDKPSAHYSCTSSTPEFRHDCRTAAVTGDSATAATAAVAESPAHRRIPPVKLDPETKAKHKRPAGWLAPGPATVGSGSDPSLTPQQHETLSYLTGDWRIFQLKDGHRWSMDDMMTAYVALQEAAAVKLAAAAADDTGGSCSSITHTLDIGCGIGSVLLMVAWGLRRQHMEQQRQRQPNTPQQQQQQQQQFPRFCVVSVGVEAQAMSYQLAQRSIRYNLGADVEGHHVQVFHQDLRQALPLGPVYQLVTGTPPYIPQGSGGKSDRPQKAPCCLETRGGIEDYCAAAATALAPGGVFVVCGGIQGQPAKFKGRRTQLAAAAAGLVITRQVTIVTREGKPPLFAVYVMRKADEVLSDEQQWRAHEHQLQQCNLQEEQVVLNTLERVSIGDQIASGQRENCEEVFVVQRADGRHTQAWHDARASMGLPPLVQE